MTWALRRQIIIVCILVLLVGGLGFFHFAPKIFVAATCTDSTQNGDETGVDCGGSCINLCSNDAKDPVVLWVRAFNVTGSTYTVVAYVENQNNAALASLPYEFRLYDDKGVFVSRVQGSTMIPPTGRYVIMMPGINAGSAHITRATIAFAKMHGPWQRISDTLSSLRMQTASINFLDKDTIPKLSATLKNPSPTIDVTDLTVAAIMYDKDDNAIAVSQTLVPELAAGASVPIIFTWPKPLPSEVVRSEILPLIDVFHIAQ